MKYLKFLLTFPQAEAVNSFVKAKATGISNTPSTEHQYRVLSRTRDCLYDTHSIVMCSQFQSSAEELQSWDTLSQEKVPRDRGENCGVSTDLRKNLVFPTEGKPPMYYKSLEPEREGTMGWCRAREEKQHRRTGAYLGKWWLLGRWSPAAGTGGESAFLSVGSRPAAGDWKLQVGSLPPVCAISLFGCWTTPDGEREDHVWLTLSCCPISPGLLMETHPELQHWPKPDSSCCLTQTL